MAVEMVRYKWSGNESNSKVFYQKPSLAWERKVNLSQKIEKLFVIDAMALAFRNFHAFGARQITTSSGLPTSALFGTAQFILNLVKTENPDYLMVATDSKEKTFRHDLYPNYKANRTEMPAELAVQIPYLFELFEALDLPLLKVPGLEADDLIGAIAKKFSGPDVKVYIVSGDKDFMQLIDDNVFLYTVKKSNDVQVVDSRGVFEKFGCTPNRVVDVLAIMGDSADNVPGVKGIGEKGAMKLVGEFGSLEAIYNSIDRLPPNKQREALLQSKDIAFLSKELVTIRTDHADLPELSRMKLTHEAFTSSNQKLVDLFKFFEFRTLAARFFGNSQSSASHPSHIEESQKSIDSDSGKRNSKENVDRKDPLSNLSVETPTQDAENVQKPFSPILIKTETGLHTLKSKLIKQKCVAIDTETTGLDIIQDRPVGISFYFGDQEAYYVSIDPKQSEVDGLMVNEVLGDFFRSSEIAKLGHNLKFDLQMLKNIGICLDGPLHDSMLESYVSASSESSYSLDALSEKFISLHKIKTKDLIGSGKSQILMSEVDIQKLTEYACEDVYATYKLHQVFNDHLMKLNVESVYRKIELPLMPVIADMERAGIFVDAEELALFSDELEKTRIYLEQDIFTLAGLQFNIQSPKQLADVLFEKLKIHEQLGVKRLKKTKTGFSTDVGTLERLDEHPLAQKILEFRSVMKLKSTYVDALPQLINSRTGRIHTSFHQTGTATGRLSSSDPNLQNIPIRTALGQNIRRAFKPQHADSVLISADYSQIELRLLAHMSADEGLVAAFTKGEDIHRLTAAKIFGKEPNEVSSEDRSRAKAINFGIIYGMGPSRLARQTGVSFAEASEFIKLYFVRFPRIKEFIKSTLTFARENGFTQTLDGRRRYIENLDSANQGIRTNAENMAVNSPIQGTAADLIKKAMIVVHKRIKEEKLATRMLLQVHDELVFEGPREEAEFASSLIRESMAGAMSLKVPLEVTVGVGQNWLEAH